MRSDWCQSYLSNAHKQKGVKKLDVGTVKTEEVGMSRTQAEDNTTMVRKIVAVLVGVLVYFALEQACNPYKLFPYELLVEYYRVILFVGRLLFFIVATVITGFIARRRGWLYGFMVSLLLPLGFIIYVIFFTESSLLDIFFWKDISDRDELLRRVYLLQLLAFVAVCMVGGHLGQLLAQKWHKRSRKKTNALSGED